MPLPARWLSFVLVASLAAPAAAQLTVVVPNGMATAEGSTSNAFPWGRGGSGLRIQNVYGAGNFTAQGITYPILISRLRYRPNGSTSSAASNYPVGGTVTMSTSPLIWSAVTTTFANQTGADATVVFSGPLSWPAATVQAGPCPFLIDLPLTTPFVYNPTAGDLDIDTDIPIQAFTGTPLQLDVHASGSQCSRVFLSTGYVNGGPNLTTPFAPTIDHGVVVEITYVPASGSVALQSRYGTGCIDRSSASFYQQFPGGTFNLSNSGLQMLPNGTGYVVVPASNPWHTPTGTNLNLGDNAVSGALPLGFTFSYPGGSTTSLYASSNGFVWPQANSNNGCCASTPADLLSMPARFCALWTDLDPAAGGTVVFDVDAQNQIGYVTWTGVPETTTSNLNTFQLAFHGGGQVDMQWQSCAATSHTALVGWSPGGGARDPGSTALSSSLPIITQPDLYPITLDASARPVTGTSVTVTTRNIPAGTPLGAAVFSLGQINPGVSLAPLGMPGCSQYVNLDFANVFVPGNGTGTFAFSVPNNAGLTGLHFYCQSATFSAGLNTLGVLATNGVAFLVGTQ